MQLYQAPEPMLFSSRNDKVGEDTTEVQADDWWMDSDLNFDSGVPREPKTDLDKAKALLKHLEEHGDEEQEHPAGGDASYYRQTGDNAGELAWRVNA